MFLVMNPNPEILHQQEAGQWDQGETEKVVLWSLDCHNLMSQYSNNVPYLMKGLFDIPNNKRKTERSEMLHFVALL